MFDTGKVMEVVNFVWENRARIVDIIENLPQTLRETGAGIESAGDSAMKASQFLNNRDRQEMDAVEMSRLAANALNRAQSQIGGVVNVIDHVKDEMNGIPIPCIKVKQTEIMGFSVVSGLDIGEEPLLSEAANQLDQGAENLRELMGDLREVAQHLAGLSRMMGEMAGDLYEVGTQLKQSGGTLRAISGFGD